MSEIFIPKWSKAEGNGSQFMKNLEKHLRYEVDLEKYEAKKREIEVGQENQQGNQVDGLGQLKASIPAREYFRWEQFKPGCWGDKQFVNEMLRDNPAFKAKSLKKKTFVQGGFDKPSFA
jgi:hypothetical protein